MSEPRYRGMSVHIREATADPDLVSAADGSKDLAEVDHIVGIGAGLARQGRLESARHHVEACGPIVERLRVSAIAAASARDELERIVSAAEHPEPTVEVAPVQEPDPMPDDESSSSPDEDASLSDPPRRSGKRR